VRSLLRIVVAIVVLASPMFGEDPVQALMHRIAVREGFYVKGTPPRTHNNPGSLVFARQRNAEPGDFGPKRIAKFKTEVDGWRALERDIRSKIARGILLGTAWAYLKESE
jgi:hypothetical protein